jgi:hypothetical protein
MKPLLATLRLCQQQRFQRDDQVRQLVVGSCTPRGIAEPPDGDIERRMRGARFDQRFVEASELFDLVRLQVVVRPCLADPRPEIEPQYPSSSERLEFVPGQHRGLGRD